MATFPLSLPLRPKLRDFSMRPLRASSSHQSPFALKEEVQVFSGRIWQCEFTLPTISDRLTAEKWITMMLLLDGKENTVLIGDPDATDLLGDLTDSVPLVDGIGQNGRVLNIKGLDPSRTGIFFPGDYFQLGIGAQSRLYKVLEQVDADASGQAAVTIWPQLRESPSDEDPIITSSSSPIFIDNSASNHTFTVVGKARLTRTFKKFGEGALDLPNITGNNWLETPDSLDWYFGTGQFTIQFFVRPREIDGLHTVVSHWESVGNQRSWAFQLDRTSGVWDMNFFKSVDGVESIGAIVRADSVSIQDNMWQHMAVSRDSSGDMRLFLNGNQVGATVNYTGEIFNSSADLVIGNIVDANQQYYGQIDQLEIIKGKAIYTEKFNPPSKPRAVTPDHVLYMQFDEAPGPRGLFRLVSPEMSWSTDLLSNYQIQFAFREAW